MSLHLHRLAAHWRDCAKAASVSIVAGVYERCARELEAVIDLIEQPAPMPPPGNGAKIIEGLRDAIAYAQDDFARRRRTVHLDGRGDAAPRNPAHDEGDLA